MRSAHRDLDSSCHLNVVNKRSGRHRASYTLIEHICKASWHYSFWYAVDKHFHRYYKNIFLFFSHTSLSSSEAGSLNWNHQWSVGDTRRQLSQRWLSACGASPGLSCLWVCTNEGVRICDKQPRHTHHQATHVKIFIPVWKSGQCSCNSKKSKILYFCWIHFSFIVLCKSKLLKSSLSVVLYSHFRTHLMCPSLIL